jgi:pimeloyl-ACP methyl ester carboxylesterase
MAARLAERVLFTPRGRRRSPRGDAFLHTGARREHLVNGDRIVSWRWGAGRPVLCLHGWAGSAAQFSVVAPALVAKGHEAVAFDAAAHGLSSGKQSSIVAMRDALVAIAAEFSGPVSIVAHSGGATAATLAIDRGLIVERAVFVGPSIDPAALMEERARSLGISPRLLDGVKARAHQRVGIAWNELDIRPHARRRSEPLLVVHDREDESVSWREGVALAEAWPQAELMLTNGLGHRRVLYDASVADAIALFISTR